MTGSAEKAWQWAESLLRAGEFTSAENAYRQLASIDQLAPLAYLRLSLLAQRRGSFRAAVENANAAFACRIPGNVDLLEMVAKRLVRLGNLEAVNTCVDEILDAPDVEPGSAAELAKLLIDVFIPEPAEKLLERAKAGGLATPAVNYLHGVALTHLGEMTAAEQQLKRAAEVDPSFAQAHWMLSKLHGRRPDKNHIAQMEYCLQSAKGQDAALLGYALFNELDELGDSEKAWSYLERAMAIRRTSIRYDPQDEQRIFKIFMEGEWGAQYDHRDSGSKPIFIIGLPRSGTTLLETLLGRHSNVAVAGELHDAVIQLRWVCDCFGGFQLDHALAIASRSADLGAYGRRYMQATRWRTKGKQFFTDKMPSNFMLLGPLAAAIPNAVFLHVDRDPIDVCFSNIKEMFAGPYAYSYDQREMAEHFLAYRKLMERWKRDFPGRILDVSYEGLVENVRETMQKVTAFCSLAWEESVLGSARYGGAVSTASAVQVREKVHQRFVGRSRKYWQHLRPLINRLEEGMESSPA